MSSTALPGSPPPPMATTVSPMARNDFAPWLPAMLVKELRQGLRTRGFVGVFIGFQIVMVLILLGTVLGSSVGTATTRAVMSNTINGFFWTLLSVQLLLATPIRALGSLQVELESRSLDLLVLTRLTAWRIVLGKWISLMAQATLLLVAMLPYGIVRYFMGSVDLVQDATKCAALLGCCGLLTAAGLAGSGLPKVMRILLPIVLIIGLQIARSLLSASGPRLFSSGPRSGSISGTGMADTFFWWSNGALILAVLLVAAVRRIAPPADNHLVLARGLALLALLGVPLWFLSGDAISARDQLQFAAIFLFVGSAIDLTSVRAPMAVHWRGWLSRHVIGRWLGRFLLPGWPSALLYAVAGAALIALCTQLPGLVPSGDSEKWVRLTWLALTALVFPAVVVSFFAGARRSPAAWYFGVFIGFSILAGFAAIVASNPLSPAAPLLGFAQTLPVSGWWITLFSPDEPGPTIWVIQAVLAVLVLVAACWQSRGYWKRASEIAKRLGAANA